VFSSELIWSRYVPEQPVDAETAEKKDLRQLEESLQNLWEKARSVSEMLLHLKAENKELQTRISSLETKERRANEELQRRENEVEEIRMQLVQAQANGSSLFTKEELEGVKSRLRELIAKINSRL
jgi:chromosome segregation ATPase